MTHRDLRFTIAVLVSLHCSADRRETAAQMNATQHAQVFQIAAVGSIGEPDTFGRVVDVTAGPQGRVYVLDGYYNRLLAFDAGGRSRSLAGQPGQGPGELRHPVSVELDDSGDIYVLDPANLRLTVYRDDVSLAHVRDIPIPFPASDMCMLHDRAYAMGLFNGLVVHELNEAGEVVSSFGDAGAPDRFSQARAGTGHMLCLPTPDLIVTMSTTSPSIRAYGSAGELRWENELSAFHETAYESSNGTITPRFDSSGYAHTVLGLHRAFDGVLLVQLGLRSIASRGPDDFGKIESRFVEIRTGRELLSRTDIPWLLAVEGDRAFSMAFEPHPIVRLLRTNQ